MARNEPLTRVSLRTPKAAAIAGIVFSAMLIFIFWLLRVSVPADPLEPGTWLSSRSEPVLLALNLIPFAGIAFLWFLGALRDRLGQLEDRFFATVFFGSALLFVAMLFAAAAVAGAFVMAFAEWPDDMMKASTFHFARAVTYNLMNVYAIKMAGMFMISTSTVIICTAIASRWIGTLGYILALTLLFGSYYIGWSFMVLPIWVLLMSISMLIDESRRTADMRSDD